MRLCFLILIMALILPFILYGCNNNFECNNTLFSMLNNINKKHASIVMDNSISIDKNVFSKIEDNNELTMEEYRFLTEYEKSLECEQYSSYKILSKSHMIEDVNKFFKLLKFTYGAYEFFGGEEIFKKAQDQIIKYISELDINQLTADTLEKLLIDNLSFINDAHFCINSTYFAKPYYFYYSDEYEFLLDSFGYYTINDNIKYYVTSVNNINRFEEFKELFKLSINQKGDLVYYLGDVMQKEDTVFWDFTIMNANNSYESTRSVELKISKNQSFKDNNIFDYKIIEGIPIISIRKMVYDDDTLLKFTNTAHLIKEYPVAIIDIRGNTGGSDILPIEWFMNFTNKRPSKISISATLYNDFNNYTSSKFLSNMNTDYENELLKDIVEFEKKMVSNNINEWIISMPSREIIKNKVIIFLLIDKSTASSAENFLEYLYGVENVIFVGANTSGAKLSNIFTSGRLPNSKINFKYGNSINLYLDQFSIEGYGFTPDIWIGDEYILEKTIRLISKHIYKLK